MPSKDGSSSTAVSAAVRRFVLRPQLCQSRPLQFDATQETGEIVRKLMLGIGLIAVAFASGCSGAVTESSSGATTSVASASASSSAAPTPSSTPSPTPTPTATGPVELTVDEAGERYLEFVCVSNAAKDKFSQVQQRLDPNTYSDTSIAAKIKKVSQQTADIVAASAQGLSDPSFVWPQAVQEDMQKVGADLYEQSAWYASVADSETWADVDTYRGSAKSSRAASAVRLALGLPPRGSGCPGD